MTLRLKDPVDADRIWMLKHPGYLEVQVTDSRRAVKMVVFECRSTRNDDTRVFYVYNKRTAFVGRMTGGIIVDEKSVTIDTTGGQVVIYR